MTVFFGSYGTLALSDHIMEEIPSTFGGSQPTQSAGESDTFIAIALLVCFTLILFVAFRYASFLPARRYASAGLCDSDVSVCLSVCPSVTRRYCA